MLLGQSLAVRYQPRINGLPSGQGLIRGQTDDSSSTCLTKKIMELCGGSCRNTQRGVFIINLDRVVFGYFQAAEFRFPRGNALLWPEAYRSPMRLILEPLRLPVAIPNVKGHWCLREMDLKGADLEDDTRLLRLMVAGEERGFVDLYRKYQGPVYRFALQICGIRHIAEEVTQETFLSLIRAPRNYRADRGPLLVYLFGIARRLVWKSARRDRVYEGLDNDRNQLVSLPEFADDFVRKDEVKRVRNAILSLPRKYREVIVLCSLQELSYQEAARVVGSSIGTVRSRVHRAKQLLLRKLHGPGSMGAANGDLFLSCPRGLDYDV
jgi:RNA polymerase sigma-70 factor, ECF subfamily